MMREATALMLALVVQGCAARSATLPAPHPPGPSVSRSIALPAAPADGVMMDYIAYDRARRRLWVPAGNTGNVDVIDVATQTIVPISGFPTATVERHGTTRTVGPSSATVAPGTVYVGNRGDNKVCAVNSETLRVGACAVLDSMPDGLLYVPSLKEVWVTTPRDQSIRILDAGTPGGLALKEKTVLDGDPEGFAVDDERGTFYTNLEDKDRTVAVDLKTRRVIHTWLPGCGQDGPKGLAIDHTFNLLVVACADRVVVLDVSRNGAQVSTLETGAGVDNIEYLEAHHTLYAAAARAARLTIARLAAHGTLTLLESIETGPGVRNAVVTDEGVAYLTDSRRGSILVVPGK